MSENEFLNALKEEMPEGFGRELLAQLKAEDKKKVTPFPTFWTVAVASIVTVLVGFVLFFSRMPQSQPLQESLFLREPITRDNAESLAPALSIGNGMAVTMVLSSDNNTLAVGTTDGIYLHDAHDLNAPATFLGFPSEFSVTDSDLFGFYHLEFSDDGRLFLALQWELSVLIYQWDADSGSFVRRYEQSLYNGGVVQAFDISPDGNRFLMAKCGSDLGFAIAPFGHCQVPGISSWRIMDMTSGEIVYSDFPTSTANSIVAINADWTFLAYQENRQVKLFDLQTGEEEILLEITEGHSEFVSYSEWYTDELHQLVFSPDGTKIGIIADPTSENSAPIDWWEISDLLDDESPRRIPPYNRTFHQNPIPLVAFSHEDIFVSWRLGFKVYDYSGDLPIETVELDGHPSSLLTSDDGQRIYTLGNLGVLTLWSTADLSILSNNLNYTINRYPYVIDSYIISQDSNSIVNDSIGGLSGLPYLWNIGGTSLEQTPLTGIEGHYSPIYSTVFSHDGRYLAFYQDYNVWLYEVGTNERTLLTTVPSAYTPAKVPYLAFREDGSLLMLQTENGYIEFFTFSPEMLETGDIPHPMESLSLQSLAVEDYDELTKPDTTILLSPNGLYLAVFQCEVLEPRNDFSNSCERLSLRLFDTVTGTEIRELVLNLGASGNHALSEARFSADSAWLAVDYCVAWQDGWGCANGIHEFEFFSMEEFVQAEVEPSSLRIEGSFGNTWSFDFASYADGSFLLTTTSENFTRLWHVQGDGESQQIGGIASSSVTIAPDLSYIVGSDDGKIVIWSVPASDASGD